MTNGTDMTNGGLAEHTGKKSNPKNAKGKGNRKSERKAEPGKKQREFPVR